MWLVEVVRESPEDGVEEWFFRDQRDYWGNVGVASSMTLQTSGWSRWTRWNLCEKTRLKPSFGRQLLALWLRVPGAGDVSESDTEVWLVMGEPSGEQLALAADAVVDRFADQIAASIDSL